MLHCIAAVGGVEYRLEYDSCFIPNGTLCNGFASSGAEALLIYERVVPGRHALVMISAVGSVACGGGKYGLLNIDTSEHLIDLQNANIHISRGH